MRSTKQIGGRGPNHGPDKELGSVAMATLLIMFAAMIGVVVVGRSVAHLRDSVNDGNRGGATAGAELGIAEAIALIEQGASTSFAGTVDTPSVTVAYDATSIDANTWEIYSEGTTSGATQARLVRIEREATAAATTHLALFADQLLRLHSGNSGTIDGGLGSNGQVTLGGTATTEPVTLYQPDGACTDCSQVVTADGPRSDSNPVIPTSGTQDCPDEIKFDETVDGKNGQPFLCFSGEKFEVPETLQVINPPVIIHIGSSIEIDMENSEVNTGGSAADFLLLVHKPTSWNPARLTLKDATFNGLLYAPGRLFRAKNFEGNGVFVFGEFLQGRSGTIDITYDSALDGILDGDADTGGGDSTWGITDWQKVAPLP